MTMEIQHPLFLVEADTILYGVHVTCFCTPLLCVLTPHSLPEYTYHLPRTRNNSHAAIIIYQIFITKFTEYQFTNEA